MKTSPDQRSDNQDLLILTGLVFLYTAWRMLILFFSHPQVWFEYPFEELYRGALAKDFMDGLRMPLLDYRADDYSGGSLLTASLASVFFRLLGPTVFALKMSSVFIQGITLCFGYGLLRENFSRRAAILFGFLFIFSHPTLTRHSLVTLGHHAETMALTAAALFFFLRLRKTPAASPGAWLLFGIFCGFSLWYSYYFMLTLLGMAAVTALRAGESPSWKRGAEWAAGFTAGFSPWLWINTQNHWAGLLIQEEIPVWSFFSLPQFIAGFMHPRQSALYALITSTDTLHASDPPLTHLLSKLYVLLLFLPLSIGLVRILNHRSNQQPNGRSQPLFLLLILQTVLTLLFYQAAPAPTLRYLIPAHVFLLILVSSSLSLIKTAASIPWVLLLISLNIYSAAINFSGAHALESLKSKGYSYLLYGFAPVCSSMQWKCLDYFPDFEKNLAPEDLFEMTAGIADGAVQKSGDDFEKLQTLLGRIPSPRLKQAVLLAWGSNFAGVREDALSQAWDTLAALSGPENQTLLLEGFIEGLGEINTSAEDFQALETKIPDNFKTLFWQAFGRQSASALPVGPQPETAAYPALLQRSAGTPEAFRAAYFEGLGRSFYKRWVMNPLLQYWNPDNLKFFQNESERAAVLEGMGQESCRRSLFHPSVNGYLEPVLAKQLPWKDRLIYLKGKEKALLQRNHE